MDIRYPQNFKEYLILGISICAVMVLGMMSFNLFVNNALSINNLFPEYFVIFATAFLLDCLLVGLFSRWFIGKHKLYKYTTFLRVALMAGIMTFVVPLLEMGLVMSVEQYIITFSRNYIVALLLQIFVAMKFGLLVLAKYRLVSETK